MGIVTGKSGKTYVLNLDNLGGYKWGKTSLMQFQSGSRMRIRYMQEPVSIPVKEDTFT